MAFRPEKVFGTFEKRALGPSCLQILLSQSVDGAIDSLNNWALETKEVIFSFPGPSSPEETSWERALGDKCYSTKLLRN